jgi:hypothetical protein
MSPLKKIVEKVAQALLPVRVSSTVFDQAA